ncbi:MULTISPECIES: efflux RND transporter periplasmic adaptor subunit [Sphingobacterium]|uniref:Resistance-nodulation-cell division (RND) efflux membrane fusion protein n=1 Tax=Sphingobacterium cellulitidis TaxID=1768011 RepID=A0A8H9KVD5_9SPHI|nr:MULTISPECIES: efflux RND transporter periplasmic adaptor subunit [Sphingobacterium]MBA8988251.1 RND family efflux transporter MFP subunit [Sphingobacterium soli]OYD43108.1 efflux transporter periplasmic adaptor subunit [Sphingobacterium cellulitidis]OYD47553.1 efflux transporter periplasmic adaptor subunit [Sphingobacterium cellulitidis]WFB62494.1 efflux RND transporter periplasmic adaptor subunit [Sphingobacterium sp. WM]GGE30132.1 resistance-nodulation-cell division (RND) efflux membrane 
MKRTLITLIVIIAAGAGIYLILQKNKAKNDADTAAVAEKNAAVAVRIDTAENSNMSLEYLANGTFMPKQEVTVAAETGGRVVRVMVDEGSRVSAGQTLAIVEGDKLNVNVANAQAAYDNAQANLMRFENALSTGGVTQQQVDQARLQFESSKNNLKSAKLNAGDVTIKTSVSGIVNSRKIEPGAYVSPGTPAFDIVNVSTLKLRVNVDEKNVATLRVGQAVQVRVSVYADKEFSGKITFIAPKSDGSLNFPVEIEIANNPNNELRAGMYGTAVFGASGSSSVLVVPRTAFVGSISDNKVFVLKNGKAVESTVVAGRSFGDNIEVLSGLQAGDQVIISGQINLYNNSPVEVIK